MENRRIAATLTVALAALAGCGSAPAGRQCMNTGSAGDLVRSAALMRVDIYAAGVGCDGTRVQSGSSSPVLSRSFAAGEPIRLDLPPGRHTVVITAFGDSGATQELGGACVDDTFLPGQAVCLDLMLTPAPDMAVPDANVDQAVCQGAQCPCVAAPDNCPMGQFCSTVTAMCSSGCKVNSDCVDTGGPMGDGGIIGDGGAPPSPRLLCDRVRHSCVECLTGADCALGKICSPGGACVDGCDLSKGKGCATGLTCCGMLCVDTRTDALNCNACGMACTGVDTQCCNGMCSDPNTDKGHCGGCGTACSLLNGSPTCVTGTCTFSCANGFAHCASGNTGCETDIANDPLNCGGCAMACSSNNIATPTCANKVCNGVCNTDRGDCDGNKLTNGCETNLTNSTLHCGACGANCNTNAQNATGAFCVARACDFTSCSASFDSCDGNRANGCETDLRVTTVSCGMCATNCNTQVQNAAGEFCAASACNYASCDTNFDDCDASRTNGCETNLTNTTTRCGSCSTNCTTQVLNANGKSCASSLCNYTTCISTAVADCDLNRTNGCEVTLATNTTNCGACGTSCNTQVQNATGKFCAASLCDFTTCSANFDSCDSNRTNGCETNLTNTTTSCAACTTNCNVNVLNATGKFCSSSLCNYGSCSAGFDDCDVNRTNGCEVTLATNTANCGACGTNCNTQVLNANGKSCASSLCNYTTCTSGAFADCDLNRTNGCEVTLATNINNCGACGTNCNTQVQNATGKLCSGSLCDYGTCSSPFGDCDANRTNGCEANLSNTTDKCGLCTISCNVTILNASGAFCSASACNYASCNANFLDCNANRTNGCECETGLPAAGCCSGGTCQTKHTNNGVGGTYFDCFGLGTPGMPATYVQQMASDAADSATGLPGVNQGVFTCGSGGNRLDVLCRGTDSTGATGPCTCWSFAGGANRAADVGHVRVNAGTTGCFCPDSTYGTWN